MLTATPATATPVEATATGRITIHPRYRVWLRKCGIATANEILSLRGEVVGGHADRHVVKVELHSGSSVRGAYLKREHVVGRRARLRNWLGGFGWVSRAEREALTLQKLEDLGLPGPQWLAYGEDAGGRAFLLIEELTGAIALREFLTDYALSADEGKVLAERLGRVLAECHAAGLGTPELAAKHILVRRNDLQPTLIDWQSGSRNRPVATADVVGWFGRLQATLPDECASARSRLRMLWAYRRVLKSSGQRNLPRFAAFVGSIRDAAEKAGSRSSVRQQLGVVDSAPQRLVWLAGEAFVAIPEFAATRANGTAAAPFYDLPAGRETFHLLDGTTAELRRYRSFAPLGFLAAALRERPWRSRGAKAARVLFHLQRFGIPGPKLLAFGQRKTSAFTAESFVLTIPPEPGRTMSLELEKNSTCRDLTLSDIGRCLKRIHAARLRPTRSLLGKDPLLVLASEVAVASAIGVRIVRRITERNARADLRFALAGLDHTDKMRVLRSYLGTDAGVQSTWERFAAAVS